MIDFSCDKVDVDSLRFRIAEMNEFELMRCARTAAILNAACPNEKSSLQLEEARLELSRRYRDRRGL